MFDALVNWALRPTTAPRTRPAVTQCGCRPVRYEDSRFFSACIAASSDVITCRSTQTRCSGATSGSLNQSRFFVWRRPALHFEQEQQANESGRLHSGISGFDRIPPPFCHGTVVLYGRGGGYPHRGNQTWQEL